ncbi:enoyl-CoA hydratase-related protein [Enterovirga sp.]|uniref:enoyl-CoA hydratase/isomerase family protein n=1 Tax=Enterovirga sp. TaxID=2026350 RepID=UPI002621FA4E|nr:enoyl-CoA hydratase-related protein [Enterovirga sp.]MDB5591708.1 Enoyl-CoA hydratase [Enterovirga sp.]
MSGDEGLLYGVDQGIATITLNRPERRNAINVATANRLRELWDEIDADPAVRVVIVTSADCGTFSAGMDLKEAAEIRRERGVDVLDLVRDPFMERMRAVEKPLVAAMTGHFLAAGIMMAVNCDLRVGLAGTVGGITEVQRGRGSPWAVPMLWMLPQAVFSELALTGEPMSIERLQGLGFINYVEPTPDAVRARASALAGRIRDNAPLSVGAAKASIKAAMALGCDAGIAESKRLHVPVYASEDAKEGPRAFAERRAPAWTGR